MLDEKLTRKHNKKGQIRNVALAMNCTKIWQKTTIKMKSENRKNKSQFTILINVRGTSSLFNILIGLLLVFEGT